MQVDVPRHKNFFFIVFSTFLLHKTSYLFSEISKMTFFKKFHWFHFIYAAILKCILWTLFNDFLRYLSNICDFFKQENLYFPYNFVCKFNYVFSQFWPKRELVSRHEMDKFPLICLVLWPLFEWKKDRLISFFHENFHSKSCSGTSLSSTSWKHMPSTVTSIYIAFFPFSTSVSTCKYVSCSFSA